jgi:hypothetical protein
MKDERIPPGRKENKIQRISKFWNAISNYRGGRPGQQSFQHPILAIYPQRSADLRPRGLVLKPLSFQVEMKNARGLLMPFTVVRRAFKQAFKHAPLRGRLYRSFSTDKSTRPEHYARYEAPGNFLGKVCNVDREKGVVLVDSMQQIKAGHEVKFSNGSSGLIIWHAEPTHYMVYIYPDQPAVDLGNLAFFEDPIKVCAVQSEGKVLNFMGRESMSNEIVSTTTSRLVFDNFPNSDSRQSLDRPLYTGIRMIDTLVPIARGQNFLIHGRVGSGYSDLLTDVLETQLAAPSMKCVYVNTNKHLPHRKDLLRKCQEAMGLTIVTATGNSPRDILPGYVALHTGYLSSFGDISCALCVRVFYQFIRVLLSILCVADDVDNADYGLILLLFLIIIIIIIMITYYLTEYSNTLDDGCRRRAGRALERLRARRLGACQIL